MLICYFSVKEVVRNVMENTMAQSSATDAFGDLTEYTYVYTRADGRVVTRRHPYAQFDTLESSGYQEPHPQLSRQEPNSRRDENHSEHREGGKKSENNFVLEFQKSYPMYSETS